MDTYDIEFKDHEHIEQKKEDPHERERSECNYRGKSKKETALKTRVSTESAGPLQFKNIVNNLIRPHLNQGHLDEERTRSKQTSVSSHLQFGSGGKISNKVTTVDSKWSKKEGVDIFRSSRKFLAKGKEGEESLTGRIQEAI